MIENILCLIRNDVALVCNELCSRRNALFKSCHNTVFSDPFSLTAQNMKFSIKDLWSHLLKKSLMKNFIFCAVSISSILSLYMEIRVRKNSYFGIFYTVMIKMIWRSYYQDIESYDEVKIKLGMQACHSLWPSKTWIKTATNYKCNLNKSF